ncbi:MAG: Smr/MutS family protein [Phycisphaerales bacterium]|nr:Smr/MutS family protein [Phycisphaerales bacterium]
MKFSVGDKMLIKKTGEEGIVVALLDNTMAEVSVGGTIFPIYIDEIDHPYLHWFTQKNKDEQTKKILREQIPVEKLEDKKPKVASGIHLVFMPIFYQVEMEEQVERLKIFLVNQTHYTLELKYEVKVGDELLFHFQGTIQPFNDIYLHFVDWDQMQAIPRFEWRLKETLSTQYATHADVLKVRSAKLFEQIYSVQKNNLATFQYTLLEEFSIKEKERETFQFKTIVPQTKRNVRSVQEIPKYELDLHIEQLLEDIKGLSNSEMLHIQLAELQKYLGIAVRNKQDKMVVIHGNGKGVLRAEVNKILAANEFVDKVETGWLAGYGFGATIVYFTY